MKVTVLLAAAGAAAAAELFISSPGARLAAVAATPPPTPPPINSAVTPPPAAPVSSATPSATFPITGATPQTASRPKPLPPPRKGIEGVWEVAIQHANGTDYTHVLLTQTGDQITGTYLDGKNKYPLTGTLDGQAVRLIVTLPQGTTILLEGKLDGTTDMIGLMTLPSGEVPFTAAYRAKTNWIENVNPSPGGVPSQGGYTPP